MPDILVCACAVITYQNSFLAPLVYSRLRWQWARDLVSCPLCLGFHVGWVAAACQGARLGALASGVVVAVTSLVFAKVLSMLSAVIEYFGLRSNQLLQKDRDEETSVD